MMTQKLFASDYSSYSACYHDSLDKFRDGKDGDDDDDNDCFILQKKDLSITLKISLSGNKEASITSNFPVKEKKDRQKIQ